MVIVLRYEFILAFVYCVYPLIFCEMFVGNFANTIVFELILLTAPLINNKLVSFIVTSLYFGWFADPACAVPLINERDFQPVSV